MAGEIGEHEEQIAHFFLDLILCQLVTCLDQFAGFFGDFGQHVLGVGPVEPDTGGAVLQFCGAQQGGQVGRDPVERPLLRLAGALCGFDGFPVAGLLGGRFVAVFVSEDMRVAVDHFVRDGAHDGLEGEMPGFGADLGEIDGLQQQIAQFALEFVPGLTLDGVGDFVGFFDCVGGDGGEGLFDVPGAAGFRVAQAAHDFEQPFDAGVGVVDERVFSHCSRLWFSVRCRHTHDIQGVQPMPVINRIAEFGPQMLEWRQWLHRNPELGFDLPKTAAYVADRLREIGVDELHEGIAQTGMVAIINGQGEGPTIGLRADMDALPLDEISGVEYSSETQGKMHACGHDGHTTMLLGAAKYLMETRNFKGRVALIFQPAEEGGGGGEVMVQEGIMDRFEITQVYGLHNAPRFDVGTIATNPGPMMASVDEFRVIFNGKGGHAAMPDQTIDPIPAAAAFADGCQTIVSRNREPTKPLVVSVTRIMSGGAALNIIPQTSEVGGTVRSFDPELRDLVEVRIRALAAGVAAAYDLEAEVIYDRSYPATINHAEQAEFAAEVAREIVGEERVDANVPAVMGSEDFAYMLEARPGAYLFVGQGDTPMCHHPAYDFNDEIAPIGASLLARLVERAQPLS